MEVEEANPPWNARERTLIIKMQSYVQKSEEDLQIKSTELEFWLGPGDGEISIVSLTENARGEGGYSRVVVLDTRRDKEVADAARFCEEARKAKPRLEHLEEKVNRLQDTITQMEKERSGLLETIARNQK